MVFLIIGLVLIVISVILWGEDTRNFRKTAGNILYGTACIMIYLWIKNIFFSTTKEKIEKQELIKTEMVVIDTIINENDTLYLCKQTLEN